MKYEKPQIQDLTNAVSAVQSAGKGDEQSSDTVPPYTTISAYEADE